MHKGNYIDVTAIKRRRNQKIKRTLRVLVYLLMITMIIASAKIWQENKDLKQQVRDLTIMVTAPKVDRPEPARGNVNRMESMGAFKIYHYCSCSKCCGNSSGITATGTRAREGRTIAVDPSIIPLGSEVIIDWETYIAEDTGGGIKGNKIDMFVDSHAEALRLGVRETDVFIKK